MTQNGRPNESATDRRSFVKGVAAAVSGLAVTGRAPELFGAAVRTAATPFTRAGPAPNWADQIGLELYTVRDVTAKDYVGTLEKLARIGYKEIEPAGGYGNLSPKQFRALLDRLGLKMPSTHSGVTVGTDAEMEKQLAGFHVMGIEYSSLAEPRPAGRGNSGGGATSGAAGTGRAGRGARAATPAEQRQGMQQ